MQVCVSSVSSSGEGEDDDRACGGGEDGNSVATACGLRSSLRQSGRVFTAAEAARLKAVP